MTVEPEENARMAEPTATTPRNETSVTDADAERMAAIVALAWRPAWSMRRRVGCLAPIAAALRAWRKRNPRLAGRRRPE